MHKIDGKSNAEALNLLDLHPVNDLCCRRMLLGSVSMVSLFNMHDNTEVISGGVTCVRTSVVTRELPCL